MEQVTFISWSAPIWSVTLGKSLHLSVPQCPICKEGITGLKHEQSDYSYSNKTKKNLILRKYPCATVTFPTSMPPPPHFTMLGVMPAAQRRAYRLLVEVSQLPGVAERL